MAIKMERIESTKNEYIKQLKKLSASRAARHEAGLFIAEGEKCAAEAVSAGFAESLLFAGEPPLSAPGVRMISVSRAVIEAVCESKSPQDAAAVCRIPAGAQLPDHGIIAALEDVSDPQNVGAIIRTADAVGAGAVLLSPGCADPYSPRAVRAAMGSIFHIPVIIAEDFYRLLSGRNVVAGHLRGAGVLPRLESPVILIGNEARGLSDRASALATVLYKIPIYGRAESLNAAVAAGIMLYDAKRGF